MLQVVLGGFVNSSGVVLWSLLSPLGALVFAAPRQAIGWLMAYLLSVIVSGILQPYISSAPSLGPGLIVLFFVLNFAAISTIAFVLISYFVRQKEHTYELLHLEQAKSEALLLNILPAVAAGRLKEGEQAIADFFDEVTILFADLVNFTPLSSRLSASQVVALLNGVFSDFDTLVEDGVEKIETVGDEYMVASGVPIADDHAQALARLALDMCDYLTRRPAHDGTLRRVPHGHALWSCDCRRDRPPEVRLRVVRGYR